MTEEDINEMEWIEVRKPDGDLYLNDYCKRLFEHSAADGRRFVRIVNQDGSQRIDEYPNTKALAGYPKADLWKLVKTYKFEGKL
jgi:hypothetical protein